MGVVCTKMKKNQKRKKLFDKLDKLCENRDHELEEIFDGIFQCKRCFKVIKKMKEVREEK